MPDMHKRASCCPQLSQATKPKSVSLRHWHWHQPGTLLYPTLHCTSCSSRITESKACEAKCHGQTCGVGSFYAGKVLLDKACKGAGRPGLCRRAIRLEPPLEHEPPAAHAARHAVRVNRSGMPLVDVCTPAYATLRLDIPGLQGKRGAPTAVSHEKRHTCMQSLWQSSSRHLIHNALDWHIDTAAMSHCLQTGALCPTVADTKQLQGWVKGCLILEAVCIAAERAHSGLRHW